MKNIQETEPAFEENSFALNLLKGNIGKAVVETYLNYFRYEVYPFGYENHYVNVTRFVDRGPSEDTLSKVRAMPDLLVLDREKGESTLVEVKTSGGKNPTQYWMEKERFDSYRLHWPEALLAVYLIPSGKIFCSKVSDIHFYRIGRLQNRPKLGYYFDLHGFLQLPDVFDKFDRKKYDELGQEIQLILETFDIAGRNYDFFKLKEPARN